MNPDLTLHARWTIEESTGLPREVAFFKGGLWFLPDDAGTRTPETIPYDIEFTNAFFSIIGLTNLAGLQFPRGFVGQQFGTPKRDVKRNLHYTALNTVAAEVIQIKTTCSLNDFVPSGSSRFAVQDRRLINANPKIEAVSYVVQKRKWPGVGDVRSIHQKGTGTMPRASRRQVIIWFCVVAAVPLILIALRKRSSHKLRQA